MGKVNTGLWVSRASLVKLDGRKQPLKGMNATRRALSVALGGDPSPQQAILIDRAVYLLYRIHTFEARAMEGHSSTDGIDAHYLAWVGSLRRTLETLGLERRLTDVTDVARELAAMRSGGANGRP